MTISNSQVIVRDARADEHVVVREVTLRAYAQYAAIMSPPAWTALVRAVHSALASAEPMQRIVAERDGEVVGSVMLYPAAADVYAGAGSRVRWPELRLLAVAPEVRGAGVGRALVGECVHRARRLGAGEIGLHSSRSMRDAVRLYQHMGFVRVPEFDFRPEGAELVEAYCLSLAGRHEE